LNGRKEKGEDAQRRHNLITYEEGAMQQLNDREQLSLVKLSARANVKAVGKSNVDGAEAVHSELYREGYISTRLHNKATSWN
jgi:hypothetical protein